MGYIYILQSKKNMRYYVGSTLNIDKRLAEHNNGYVTSTRSIRPLVLKFYKKYESIREARQIEYKIKKLKSRKIIDKIISDQILILGL